MKDPDDQRPHVTAGYVWFLSGIAAVLLISAVFHTVVFLVKGTAWEGPVSWRKPIVFAISFAVTDVTLAWVLHLLPRAPRRGWVLALMFGVPSLIEVALISLQQWRGVPSHFNAAAMFDRYVVIALGTSLLPILLSLVGIAVWNWTSLPRGSSLALGMKLGVMFLILGQVVGGIIVVEGVALLRLHNGQVDALYPAITAFRLPHALALHAIQALCTIGVLVDRRQTNVRAGRWIQITASLAILVAIGVALARAL